MSFDEHWSSETEPLRRRRKGMAGTERPYKKPSVKVATQITRTVNALEDRQCQLSISRAIIETFVSNQKVFEFQVRSKVLG